MWLRSSNLSSSSNSWINIDSSFVTQFEQYFRVSFGSHTCHSWTWITYLRKSHSIVGEWMWTWISTSWFGPDSWTNFNFWTFTWLKSNFKVSISSCTSWVQICHSILFHIPFWDKGVDKIDSEIILKIWKLDRVKFIMKIIHINIMIVGCIIEVIGGFLQTQHKLNWVAFRGPIRPPPEPPP